MHWCLHNVHIEDEELLMAAILEGSAIAISDGSYKNFFGTVSWTIGNPEVAALLSGQAVCPGAAPDMDSYRSELAGIYCIMAVVKKFCSFHHIEEGSIEIGCDGLSALDIAFEKGDQFFHDVPSYNLVSAILQLRRCSPLTWSYRHVRGHHDEGSGDLDFWATRNIQMDVLAKQHLAFAQTAPRHFLIQGEPWQLWVGNRKVTSRIQAHIYSSVHDEDGRKYWKGKNDSSAAAVDLVDWKSIGHAMRGVKRGRRVFVTKHVAGMCGVGKFMKRWGQWNTDRCPRCGEPEDTKYVWLCKAPGARVVWMKAIAFIELKLRQLNTDPTLRHIILHYLSGWQSGVCGNCVPPQNLMV